MMRARHLTFMNGLLVNLKPAFSPHTRTAFISTSKNHLNSSKSRIEKNEKEQIVMKNDETRWTLSCFETAE